MYSYNILSKLFYISQDSPSGIRRIEEAISGRHYHIIVAKKDDVAGFKEIRTNLDEELLELISESQILTVYRKQ